jgi:hypothetical protein
MARFRTILVWRRIAIIAGATLLTIATWGVYDLVRNGPEFMVAFFWRQVAMLTTEDAGHGGFLVIISWYCCWAVSGIGVRVARATSSHDVKRNETCVITSRWMVILLLGRADPLQHGEDEDHSLQQPRATSHSPTSPPCSSSASGNSVKPSGGRASLLGGLGTLIALIFIVVPFLGMRIELIKPLFAKDPFGLANLDAAVHWTGCWKRLAGLLLLGALLTGHWLHGRARYREALMVVFGGGALFVTTSLFFFINRIEGYSQRAAIDFFAGRKGERCYVITKNYKSYATCSIPASHLSPTRVHTTRNGCCTATSTGRCMWCARSPQRKRWRP